MSEIITKRNEQIVHYFKLLDNILKSIEFLARNSRPLLNGERYLTDSELSKMIKISRRTLQQWRAEGNVSFIIFSGKTLYKESDIQKLLEVHYHQSQD